jgi:futalosine hydrolase
MGAMNGGLLCAATRMELETFGIDLSASEVEVLEEGRLYRIPEGVAAITGVGAPLAVLNLSAWIARFEPAWIAMTGIAGAYAGSGLEIGNVVVGETEVFADLGMETAEGDFLSLSDFPFADEAHRAPLPLWTPAWTQELRRGHGATVGRCTGTDATGERRRARFGVDFETMEGAAAALAARASGIPVLQVRAISNAAARRDMRPENVARALESLRAFWARHRADLENAP